MKNTIGGSDLKKIVVVGGGRTGTAIAEKLQQSGQYLPVIFETDYDRMRTLQESGFRAEEVSGTNVEKVRLHLDDAACVICAAPHWVAQPVAQAANKAGCHYVDMCEDLSVSKKVASTLTSPGICFAPSCGVAPGLTSAIVDSMVRKSDGAPKITAYVGAIPAEKTNRLGYGNLWGIDGLMAEYTNDCQYLDEGRIRTGPSLDCLEEVKIGSQTFEAFTTSGSIDELVHSYKGLVNSLIFKTLRYRGHLDYVQFLLHDLKLSERQYLFSNLLMNGLPTVERDRVLIHVVNRDPASPDAITCIYESTTRPDGEVKTAISDISAQHVCAVTDVLVQGIAPRYGVLNHIELTLELLNKSSFGDGLLASGRG